MLLGTREGRIKVSLNTIGNDAGKNFVDVTQQADWPIVSALHSATFLKITTIKACLNLSGIIPVLSIISGNHILSLIFPSFYSTNL